MSWAELVGILGFLLSVLLAYLYLTLYYGRLGFGILVVEIRRRVGLPYSWLIFHLYFENYSFRGKFVHSLATHFDAPDYIHFLDDLKRIDWETNRVLLVDEKEDEVGYIPLNEYLEFPLNIPAHQAQSKLYPLRVSWVDLPQDKKVSQLPLRIDFYCVDDKDKIHEKTSISLTLDDVMHSHWLQRRHLGLNI